MGDTDGTSVGAKDTDGAADTVGDRVGASVGDGVGSGCRSIMNERRGD